MQLQKCFFFDAVLGRKIPLMANSCHLEIEIFVLQSIYYLIIKVCFPKFLGFVDAKPSTRCFAEGASLSGMF